MNIADKSNPIRLVHSRYKGSLINEFNFNIIRPCTGPGNSYVSKSFHPTVSSRFYGCFDR